MIEFKCPECGTDLNAPDEAGGVKAPCPRCSKPITIPSPKKK
ncbi:MAG: hypothetical protein ACE5QF_08885 [Thermoplasmata archaeon]